jgi:hypothetical protein
VAPSVPWLCEISFAKQSSAPMPWASHHELAAGPPGDAVACTVIQKSGDLNVE